MLRCLLKSKVHRATVTEANLNYDGSLTLDRTLMDAADLFPQERVEVYDITNGQRLSTYIIEGAADSGTICINGAAAHLVKPGDLVIIAGYGMFNEHEAAGYRAKVVLVDERNRIREVKS